MLEYFDAYLIGLTATPIKQRFGFFNQNLVMEYSHEMAVADKVNVNYDLYRIRMQITAGGSKVEAGYSVQIQERDTRKKRWEQLDDDFSYDPNQLDCGGPGAASSGVSGTPAAFDSPSSESSGLAGDARFSRPHSSRLSRGFRYVRLA